MKNKKIIFLILFFLIAMITVSGCGKKEKVLKNNDTQKTSKNAGGAEKEKVDVVDFDSYTDLSDRYAVDKNFVYHWGHRKYDIDRQSFEVIGNNYAKDKNNVYHYAEIVDNADPETFSLLGYNFGKDKDNIYFMRNKIEGADFDSFEVINDYYSRDKNYFYHRNKKVSTENIPGKYLANCMWEYDGILYSGPEQVRDIKLETIEKLLYGYAKDEKYVYRIHEQIGNPTCEKIENADSKTFTVINSNFARDKNNIYNANGNTIDTFDDPTSIEFIGDYHQKDKTSVYFKGEKIKDADSKSFTVLKKNYGNKPNYDYYAKDKNHVYYEKEIIVDADSSTFKILIGPYAKDYKNIYWIHIKMEKADHDTFVVLEDYCDNNYASCYAKDKNHLYSSGTILEGINPNGFQDLHDYHHIKNKYYVYYELEIIKGADPDTFEILKYNYKKDKNNVYYYKYLVNGANPNSFKPLGGPPALYAYGHSFDYGIDDKNAYIMDKKITGSDPDTFIIIQWDYSKDKNNVYKSDKKIQDADPNSFRILWDNYSRDKSHVYFYEQTIDGADPETFEILGEGYTVDKSNVYKDGIVVENENSEEFKKNFYKKYY